MAVNPVLGRCCGAILVCVAGGRAEFVAVSAVILASQLTGGVLLMPLARGPWGCYRSIEIELPLAGVYKLGPCQ